MDWNTFFTSLFASMGGALGIALIILRSAKKRMETYMLHQKGQFYLIRNRLL